MKRTIKKITALILILVLGLSMVACGSKEDNGDDSKGDSGNETKSGDNNTYTFSEYLNKGDDYQIWYRTYSLDKSKNYTAYIIKNGKAICIPGTISCESDKYPTIGDVAQATDEEIYQELLELWRNHIEEEIEGTQNYLAEEGHQNTENTEKKLAYLQALDTSDFDFCEYTIGISTDATGNHTETECLKFNPSYGDSGSIKFQSLSSVAPEFYDSRYKGFCDSDDFDGTAYYFTRVEDSSVVITADEPGAEGITVD
ncbi:MAG: hypothetical protein ACI4GW_14475 [Lachnospiraceae bacterium]